MKEGVSACVRARVSEGVRACVRAYFRVHRFLFFFFFSEILVHCCSSVHSYRGDGTHIIHVIRRALL